MQYTGQSATLREDFAYTVRDQVSNQTRYSNLAGTTLVGSSTMNYDSVMRMTRLQHLDSSSANIANYTNTYDLASRITAEILNGGNPTTFQYDAVDEVTSDAAVSYSYDLNGNRTMSGYTTGPNNQITSDGTWNFYADKNGNIVQKSKSGEVWSFGFDNRNRMITAQDVTSAGLQMIATYTQDALGQRVQKAVTSGGSTTTTRFAFDDTRQIFADLDGSNALTMRYLLGNSVLERLARVSSGGTVAWLLPDRLGSVRYVVNASGSTIDTLVFDAYGNIVSESSPGNGGAYLWAGYRYESEAALYLPDSSEFRYYDSLTGRWRNVDRIWPDPNLWRYVRNNPLATTDPSGLAVDQGSPANTPTKGDLFMMPIAAALACSPAALLSRFNRDPFAISVIPAYSNLLGSAVTGAYELQGALRGGDPISIDRQLSLQYRNVKADLILGVTIKADL